MTRWGLFLFATVGLLVLVLALARASESILLDAVETTASAPPRAEEARGQDDAAQPARAPEPSVGHPPTGTGLLANVALSQALFAGLLVAILWYTAIPATALGLAGTAVTLPEAVGLGVALGGALYGGSEAGGRLAEAAGFDRHERVRAVLTPEGPAGWALLLLVVLPLIAGFEELLFRAAVVGAGSAALGISPWPLVLVSSVLFAAGHGAQGRAGIVVTGVLGMVLGAAFVLTGSLLAVVVAHYVVNALEFIVHEGLDHAF